MSDRKRKAPEDSLNPRLPRRSRHGDEREEDNSADDVVPSEASAASRDYESSRFGSFLEPPITMKTLKPLQWNTFVNNLDTRHDLNFGTIHFQWPKSEQIHAQTRRYWNVIQIDICNISKEPKRNSVRTISPTLLRLLQTIKAIVKTLVPKSKWPAVDAQLDMVLLKQEIEHGVFEFKTLGSDLVQLLQRHCVPTSPKQTDLLDSVISDFHSAAHNAGAQAIVKALKSMFDLVEALSIDRANYSLQHSRVSLMDGTIAFEQDKFTRLWLDGWSPNDAYDWFMEHRYRLEHDLGIFGTFMYATTEMIVKDSDRVPPTFTLDYGRLRELQTQYKMLEFQARCRQALDIILTQKVGRTISLAGSTYNGLFKRILTLLLPRLEPEPVSAALEVVRLAYRTCGIAQVPSANELEFVEVFLREEASEEDSEEGNKELLPTTPATNTALDRRDVTPIESRVSIPQTNPALAASNTSNRQRTVPAQPSEASRDVRRHPHEDCPEEQLHDLVEREVEVIEDLTPAQIAMRYCPDGLEVPPFDKVGSAQEGLLHIARRIAHIAVLHWRVWAPMLYERPTPAEEEEGANNSE